LLVLLNAQSNFPTKLLNRDPVVLEQALDRALDVALELQERAHFTQSEQGLDQAGCLCAVHELAQEVLGPDGAVHCHRCSR
jgi:hypothetical protein